MAKRMQGLESLRKKLAAIPREARKEIKKALTEGAQEIVALQKSLAPIDDGDLKDSIGYTLGTFTAANSNVRGVSTSAGSNDPDLSVTIHAGDEKAWYAALVEFGTAPHINGGLYEGSQHPGTDPQPYFYPPYRALRKRVRGRISRAHTKAAKRVAAGGGR